MYYYTGINSRTGNTITKQVNPTPWCTCGDFAVTPISTTKLHKYIAAIKRVYVVCWYKGYGKSSIRTRGDLFQS